MLIKISKIFLCVVTVIIVAALSVGQADASILEFLMDVEYSGGTEPAGTAPWARAAFADSGPNAVALTMSADNLSGTEFISSWFFNFDPALDPDLLSFDIAGTPGSLPNNINTGPDAFKAGGDGYYDIEFDFPPPKGTFADKFTAGESVVYDITYAGSGAMNVFSFNFKSFSGGDKGTYYSAAHIQSIGPGGDGSGWVGSETVVFEPVSSVLFLSGGVTLAFRRYRKNRNKK